MGLDSSGLMVELEGLFLPRWFYDYLNKNYRLRDGNNNVSGAAQVP